MFKYLFLFCFLGSEIYGELAGGRPNSFSGGNNAFAGVVNPANAVWLGDRIDFGIYSLWQKSTLNNKDNNPIYPPGKTDLTYHSKNIFTVDGAVQKKAKLRAGGQEYESTFTLATYTVPSITKLGTKHPIPSTGTTPIRVRKKTEIISAIFSLKLNPSHSIGFSIDYLRFSLLRNGYQRADNPIRSVSPGNVTNNGTDTSSGVGFSLGWRWNITPQLAFGAAWVKRSYCGQFRKYRGFEPHYGHNYTPQTIGAGFSYRFNSKLMGRLEVLWSNLGDQPGANNNILPDGQLNRNKRGSSKSPGPGLNDATFINAGLGYKMNESLSLGLGVSHRIKLTPKRNIFINHSYRSQTIYDLLSLGINYKYQKHDLFFVLSNGFQNRISGYMPIEVGGGKFSSEKKTISLALSWGYRY